MLRFVHRQELKLLLAFPIWQLVPFPPLLGGRHRLYGDRDLFRLLSPCGPRNSMDPRAIGNAIGQGARFRRAGTGRCGSLDHVPLAAEHCLPVPYCRSASELVIPSGEINTALPTRRWVDWGVSPLGYLFLPLHPLSESTGRSRTSLN
jgi:hypothetical protein